jgi:hypothetical protein
MDQPQVLCDWEQFTQGAFSDLARDYRDPGAQTELLQESTRLVEGACGRRLVPFTGHVEAQRATGVDPDEYPGGSRPMDQSSALGMSYAGALGADDGVRHAWLEEWAPRYPEMWEYTGVEVSTTTTFGGTTSTTIIGPEPDSGHVWFSLGMWVPVGSLVRFRYGGGYATTPADLQRASKFMTAWLILRELQPSKQTRDPDAVYEDAIKACSAYVRD